jgi:type I restriction enzyme, S subunit
MQAITDNLDLWTSALLTKSTAGRGSGGRVEAYGIKKLRELILELAVRGKLVEQDANDEPASEVLKEISAEKKQLVEDGKIQVPKPFPEVNVGEMNFSLPKGWEWVRFGTIAQHNSGKTLDSGRNTGQFRDYITTSNLYWGRFDLDNIRQMQITDKEIEKCTAIRGDLLICEGGEAGRAAVWPHDHDICFQNHIHRARFYGKLDPYYLYRFFEKLNATGEIDQHRKGVGISNMSSKTLALIVLPLPPLAEQHRIVAKVDELMALCDQLEQQQTTASEAHQTLVETLLGTLTKTPVRPEPVEGHASTVHPSTSSGRTDFTESWTRIANHFDTLFTTEQSIDQLKQTILQLAVMGKLVQQDPSDEPASEFLKRKELMADENIPFRIPDSWAWARVDEFAQTRLGKMLDKAKNKGTPVRYLRNINVRWFDFDLSDVKEMRFEDSELKEFALRDGDVLICEGGYPGRAAVWDEREANIYFQKAIHRVRFMNGFNPNYFVNVLRESADSGRLSSYFTGAGIQHFTGKGLMSFLVPIPPLAEQHRIVTKVNELMTLCDSLKARLAAAQTNQLHLADTIVEQAVSSSWT